MAVHAPQFPTDGITWFNIDGPPPTLESLRGRLVILDFWTLCCINCMHVLPTLAEIERRYPDRVAVIGVHSPKFAAERDPAKVEAAIARYGIAHPVIHDPNRLVGDQVLAEERMNAYYLTINAGKKSLTLNLKEERGRKILYDLIIKLDVDVFVTNQLPKNYGKLGIDYETLAALKNDLIWIGVTGFGPESNEGAYDPILQARAALMDLTGEADGPPQVLGVPLPDMGSSEQVFGLVMKALYKKAITGKGSKGIYSCY